MLVEGNKQKQKCFTENNRALLLMYATTEKWKDQHTAPLGFPKT